MHFVMYHSTNYSKFIEMGSLNSNSTINVGKNMKKLSMIQLFEVPTTLSDNLIFEALGNGVCTVACVR